jgi:deazaflavin-dependent oxidoreductase (nitroreductase family)
VDAASKHRLIHPLQKYILNPLPKALLRLGLAPPTHALLETTGRKTGRPRQTPVGNGLDASGRTFWIVAEHGRRAAYVRNIEANPRVRVKIGRRWRIGTAELLPDDDPIERQQSMPRVNAAAVRALGTDLLTVRVEFDK